MDALHYRERIIGLLIVELDSEKWLKALPTGYLKWIICPLDLKINS
jgi:hypothetical protein